MKLNDTIKINAQNARMIAHRGLSALEQQNTCAAFVAAANRSYYGIETDIHRTGDGNFILIPDNDTKAVSGDMVIVEESGYDTLRKIQLRDMDDTKNRSDLRLPSLEEYIGICA